MPSGNTIFGDHGHIYGHHWPEHRYAAKRDSDWRLETASHSPTKSSHRKLKVYRSPGRWSCLQGWTVPTPGDEAAFLEADATRSHTEWGHSAACWQVPFWVKLLLGLVMLQGNRNAAGSWGCNLLGCRDGSDSSKEANSMLRFCQLEGSG